MNPDLTQGGLIYGPFISRKQAKAQKIGSYYIGTICKHGHLDVHYVNGGCKTCCAEKKRRWRAANPQESRRRVKQWQAANKTSYDAAKLVSHKKRRETDMGFNLTLRLRRRLNGALHRAGGTAAASTKQLLGCTTEELRSFLEAQFVDGMSWTNYGQWHVDHIRPCASFDLTDPAQQRECFHFSNLQPLWAEENLSKGDKWEPVAA